MAVTFKFSRVFVVIFALLLLNGVHVRADDEAEEEKTDAEVPEETEQEAVEYDGEEVDGEDDDDDDVDVEEDNGVLVLTDENFDDVVSDKDIILVEFYAPWCGHCKSLAPEYEKAAKTLKAADPPVPLAKVDATVHTRLGSRFSIQGYPTLKIFRKGEPYDYDGPRQEDGIVNYMKEQSDPNWEPPPEAVVTLTEDNFDEFVNDNAITLVEFYAPWCGHCKKLAPEYEKAAQVLSRDGILLGKVDATQESDLAKRFDVSGYPTLKIFRKGKAYEYKGPREERGIVSHMIEQSGPSSDEYKSLKNLKNFVTSDAVIVGFFENDQDPLFQTYLDSGNDLRDAYEFGHTFDAEARSFYKVNPGTVTIIQPEKFQSKYEPKIRIFDKADATIKDLQDWYSDNIRPLVGELTTLNENKRYGEARPLVVVFYDVDFSFEYREATQIWRRKVLEVAKDHRDVTFVIAKEDLQQAKLRELELDDSGEEVNVGLYDTTNRKYRMEPDEFSEDTLREFVEAFKNGELKPVIKSQPVPKKQGAVTTVVGKNFEKIVMDKSKDVLIEFYAPWCGHCKKLEPIYKELGKKYKNAKDLVIAKMDATANDIPDSAFEVQGFPTIFFVKKNDKKNPMKFDGDRDLDGFVKYLEEHATVSLGMAKEEL
ncbi:PREDICTED: protein disulfide-isomerase A4-like [Branchiostoma belcheri]|uniref:Protein disulfide-isomerase n=1 Tax=Branchiostoma belcheri TaxID=7741 RepID=A0A6P4Z372_BRABE|nr:PREDICTED: protein disulfide-isomerase A4-like [Branchiostoma belcheri]